MGSSFLIQHARVSCIYSPDLLDALHTVILHILTFEEIITSRLIKSVWEYRKSCMNVYSRSCYADLCAPFNAAVEKIVKQKTPARPQTTVFKVLDSTQSHRCLTGLYPVSVISVRMHEDMQDGRASPEQGAKQQEHRSRQLFESAPETRDQKASGSDRTSHTCQTPAHHLSTSSHVLS